MPPLPGHPVDREPRRPAPFLWHHFEDPTDEDCAFLRDRLGVPNDWVRDSLDKYQRARFQRMDELAFIIVLGPRKARRRPEPFATVPLGIVLLSDRAITIAGRDPDAIGRLRTTVPGAADSPVLFALALLATTEEDFRRDLRTIHDASTFEEEKLRNSVTGERLSDLIDQGRSLAYFSSALRSNAKMLKAFRNDRLVADDRTRADLDEVIERNDENAELAEVFSRIHRDLMEGFSSLVSMNLNALVRTLTEITIALAIPSIIVGLWGMNVSLPLEAHELAFIVLATLVMVLAVLTFILIRFGERFRRRFVSRS
jgi:magnesium transporter